MSLSHLHVSEFIVNVHRVSRDLRKPPSVKLVVLGYLIYDNNVGVNVSVSLYLIKWVSVCRELS